MMMKQVLLFAATALLSSSVVTAVFDENCYECGNCMECVGTTETVDGQRTVQISSAKCKPSTISWMCCVSAQDSAGWPLGCTRVSEGSCEMNKCNGVDVLEIQVPTSATTATMQSHDGLFVGDGSAVDTGLCAGNSGANPACNYNNIPDGNSGVCTSEVDVSVEACKGGGSGIGDPHVQSWSGQWYDFHGQCDLVFLSNPSFNNGQGVDVHIRTTARDDFSFIEAAAVKIGDDVLEVTGWGEYMVNGVDAAEMPFTIGGFDVEYEMVNKKKHRFDIKYSERASIRISTVKDLVNVQMVNASMTAFGDSVGLMGKFGSNKFLARDGVTNYFWDHNAFGNEWQVLESEPKLFDDSKRFPQAPEKCVMPQTKTESRHRRLGETVAREAAEAACAHWGDDAKARANCVSDVMALGLDAADAGAF
jgi:hypothetical protein